jgi:hypothetical protein
MIFHESVLADLDASRSMKWPVSSSSTNAQRLFESGPRRLLCLGSGSEPDGGSVPATDERRRRANPVE